MEKVKEIIKYSIPFFLTLFIQVIVAVIGTWAISFVVAVSMGKSGETDTRIIAEKAKSIVQSADVLLLFLLISTVVTIIVFSVWYFNLYKKMGMKKDTRSLSLKNGLFIVILGVTLQLSVGGVLTVIQNMKPQWFDNYDQLMNQLMGGRYWLVLLVVGLGAPISEELVFRGVIFTKAKNSMSFWQANILQAILFGIMHGNIIQGAYAFVLGIFLGLVCHKCRTIWAPILLHMVFNLSSAFQSQIFVEESLNLGVLAVVILISVVVVAWISGKFLRNSADNNQY